MILSKDSAGRNGVGAMSAAQNSPADFTVESAILQTVSGASLSQADKVQVLRHLETVCASAEFARSDRMISFLRFITTAALENHSGDLKERTIGRQVFNKAEDWDPSIDTIVRSEARRLRTKLEAFYARLGSRETVRIVLPKRGYTPEFSIDPAPVVEEVSQSAGRRRNLAATLVLALLVAVSASVVLWVRRPEKRAAQSGGRFSTVPFTSELGKEYSPAISPDEKTVAYVWDQDHDQPDIYLRSIEEGKTERLPGGAGIRLFPAWSFDGKSLAYLRIEGDQAAVIVQPRSSGAEVLVTRITKEVGRWAGDESPLLGNPGPAWTPDGAFLIVADRNRQDATGGLFRVALDGTKMRLTSTRGEDHDLYPAVSPDGKTLAFVRYSSHGRGELYTMPIFGGNPIRLTSDRKTICGIAWERDGKSLVFSSNRGGSFQLWRQNLDSQPPQELTTNSSSASEPALSRRGDWLMYVELAENWNIWRAPLEGYRIGAPQKLLTSSGRNYDPRYSPDGKKIAFVSDRSGTMQIWSANSDGSLPVQLTNLPDSWIGGLAWSPDGVWIAFDWRPQDHSSIFLIPSSGGPPKAVEKNTYEERMPAWSHDGRSLYFNSVREGGMAIWELPLAGGEPRRVSDYGMFAVSVNADGIYYSSRAGQIWRAGPHGENPAELPEPVQAMPVMSWWLRGSDLYFTQRDGSNPDGYQFLRESGGRIVVLGRSTQRLVANAPDITVAPDGKWLLFAQEDVSNSDLKIRKPVEGQSGR